MGRLQQRLTAAVVAMGILTAVSVLVADLAAPEVPAESTEAPESRTRGDQGGALPANQTVPTIVTPPRG